MLPFGGILAATKDGKEITKFPTLDEVFLEVAESVSKALDKLERPSSAIVKPSPRSTNQGALPCVEPQSASTSFNPRSSNLTILKEFTDRDKDLFCQQSIEYLSRFFENPLNELETRNLELETNFRQRNADSFECVIYKNGKKISQCGIWRSSGGISLGDICYNSSGISQTAVTKVFLLTMMERSLGFSPYSAVRSAIAKILY